LEHSMDYPSWHNPFLGQVNKNHLKI